MSKLSGKDFLILAQRDYKMCLLAEKDFPDEYAVNGAAYHIQQAVEKTLKALMLFGGEEPDFTHDILKLLAKCEKAGIAIPTESKVIANTLTKWEASTRYDPYEIFIPGDYEKAKKVFLELYSQAGMMISEIKQIEASEENEEEYEPEL